MSSLSLAIASYQELITYSVSFPRVWRNKDEDSGRNPQHYGEAGSLHIELVAHNHLPVTAQPHLPTGLRQKDSRGKSRSQLKIKCRLNWTVPDGSWQQVWYLLWKTTLCINQCRKVGNRKRSSIYDSQVFWVDRCKSQEVFRSCWWIHANFRELL